MTTAVPVMFAIERPDDLLGCFDATCADVFVTACHLVDGDRDRAEAVMTGVYLALRDATERATPVLVDHQWIVATALRQTLGQRPNGTDEALTAVERAALELHRVDGLDVESIGATLGLSAVQIALTLSHRDDHGRSGADLVDDLLRRSELWLDDATRRRTRGALRRRPRPEPARAPDAPDRGPDAGLGHVRGGGTNAPANAGASPTNPGPAHPRSRRRAIAATVALATVVTGVALASTDRSTGTTPTAANGTAPAGTTAATPASTAAPSPSPSPSPMPATSGSATIVSTPAAVVVTGRGATRPPTAAPGFVIDPPPTGFELVGASERVNPSVAGRFLVWAEPEATRHAGRWLAITTTAEVLSRTAILPGASRESIGDGAAVMTTDSDGVLTLMVQPATGGQFALTGGGYSADELRQLAAGITLDNGVPTVDAALDDLRDGLEPLVDTTSGYGSETGSVGVQVTAGPRRVAIYRATDGGGYIEVVAQPSRPADIRMGELVLPASGDTLAPDRLQRSVQTGGLTLSVGGAPEHVGPSTARSTVRLQVGGETVTLTGDVALYQLLGAAPSVRMASDEEWVDAFTLSRPETEEDDDDGPPGLEFVQVGRTATGDGSRWTASLTPDPVVARIEVRNNEVAGIMGEIPVALDVLHPVHEFVSMTSTIVMVTLDGATSGTATGVRIEVGGGSPVTVPLVAVGRSGLLAAAWAFSEVQPYALQLVDDNGNELGALTP